MPDDASVTPETPARADDATTPDDVARTQVDPATRLALARLASGTSTLAGAAPAPRVPTAGVGRVELVAFGAALLGVTLIGVALPQAGPVQARAVAAATTPAAVVVPATPIAVAAKASGDTTEPEPATDAAVDDVATAVVPAPAAAVDVAPVAAPAEDASADTTAPAQEDPTPAAEDDTPLPTTGTAHLSQVALVVVHGDQPARWQTAVAGSAARGRAALGTTFTGFAQLPAAPLASGLAAIAGQVPNAATVAGCDLTPAPLVPGTVDDRGRVAGTGCDYPAGTPSLPTAIAVDGRRWKAYAPVAADQAVPALCGTGAPTGPAEGLARTSALKRLADLASSGACEAVASPLTALKTDLAAEEPPTWIVVEVGACGTNGCDEAETVARDRDLDETLATLTAKDGLAEDGAAFVIGDGGGDLTGLAPADPAALVTGPESAGLPAAVATGALLVGPRVAKDATDPLPIDPIALARTQATWLAVPPPGWAGIEGTTALAVPAG